MTTTLDVLKKRDGSRCRYCGRKYNLSVEHLTPICRGGKNLHNNMGVSCRKCNWDKGPLTDCEYLILRGDPILLCAKTREINALLATRAHVDKLIAKFRVY